MPGAGVQGALWARPCAAPNLGALASIPGNRLEPLKTGRKGQYSIRINLKYRVCFRWEFDGAYDVEITDYHRG